VRIKACGGESFGARGSPRVQKWKHWQQDVIIISKKGRQGLEA
jgi:hypothetical protein